MPPLHMHTHPPAPFLPDTIAARLARREADIERLIAALTLEEKVSLCHAAGKFRNGGVARLGIPPLVMSDGPHGVRQEIEEHGWGAVECDTDHTTYLPVGTVLAATWNPALARAFGEVLGSESRARGKDVILGPGFNIIRDPLCGRNFEYYSEDPHLVRMLVPEAVKGIQSQDTAACAKHLALNNQELNRLACDARPGERALREIYLPGFEAAVREGGVLTVMGAYNQYRGQWCCHNRRLLVDILKGEWGFQGLVVSDWNGTHSTEEAARNGLDIEMGTETPDYGDFHLANAFLAGLESGRFDVALVDDKVRRILRVVHAVGLRDPARRAGRQHPPEHIETARRIAAEGVVLLRNDGALPLDRARLRRVAVIGDNADRRHGLGGGSSAVKALHEITPLEGLREALGDAVEIVHAKGYPEEAGTLPQIPCEHLATIDAGSGVKGWRLEWNSEGHLQGRWVKSEFREQVSLAMADGRPGVEGLRDIWWSTRWTAELVAPESGVFTFALNADYWAALHLDDRRLVHFECNAEREARTVEVPLEKGRRYRLRVEYGHNHEGDAFLQFGWFLPGRTLPRLGDASRAAVEAARGADAVIFCGGLNHFHDNEGLDRNDYRPPGGQDALIEALLAVNPEVHVLLVGGSAHAMPWAERVRSIVLGGYAGMECGRVFADVLLGDVNPSGKLPYTIARRLEDYPARTLGDYRAEAADYPEGVFVGYRWFDARGIEPLFPFGHGLSYTRFGWSSLEVAEVDDGDVLATVAVTLTNLGRRAGQEVVQLYLEDVESAEPRPPRELKRFRKVALEPGESRTVRFSLTRRDCSYWSDRAGGWVCEPGVFVAHVGASSRDLPLRASFEVGPGRTAPSRDAVAGLTRP